MEGQLNISVHGPLESGKWSTIKYGGAKRPIIWYSGGGGRGGATAAKPPITQNIVQRCIFSGRQFNFFLNNTKQRVGLWLLCELRPLSPVNMLAKYPWTRPLCLSNIPILPALYFLVWLCGRSLQSLKAWRNTSGSCPSRTRDTVTLSGYSLCSENVYPGKTTQWNSQQEHGIRQEGYDRAKFRDLDII